MQKEKDFWCEFLATDEGGSMQVNLGNHPHTNALTGVLTKYTPSIGEKVNVII